MSYLDLGNVDIGGNYLVEATRKSAEFTSDAATELGKSWDNVLDTGHGARFYR
ncbi:MAG: hypothetical protein Q9M43_10710 [Sulfurimonas sp.]|nr:hypothetical protein [Sulfurimonas sp.]